MKYDTSGLEFDFQTQRFFKNRWETPIGKSVYKKLVEGIKNNVEIRGILDDYVLNHIENSDPYAYPYYPKDEMKDGTFWVITHDDLRGISFTSEDFSNTRSLEKKDLSYSRFSNVKLNKSNFYGTDFTRTIFWSCDFAEASITDTGFYTLFDDCNFEVARFFDATLLKTRFRKCNLKNVVWGVEYFDGIEIDNLSVLDRTFSPTNAISNKPIDNLKIMEAYRMFRLAYEEAEIWDKYDWYLLQEKTAYRKTVLWPQSKTSWFKDWLVGFFFSYGLKPAKILILALLITLFFAVFYWAIGKPFASSEEGSSSPSFWQSLYFSMTTFSTLGYGDYSFKEGPWWLSFISSLQAWLGAATIASFVATLMRKLLRR